MCIRIKEGSINVTMLVAGTAVLFQSEDTTTAKDWLYLKKTWRKAHYSFKNKSPFSCQISRWSPINCLEVEGLGAAQPNGCRCMTRSSDPNFKVCCEIVLCGFGVQQLKLCIICCPQNSDIVHLAEEERMDLGNVPISSFALHFVPHGKSCSTGVPPLQNTHFVAVWFTDRSGLKLCC